MKTLKSSFGLMAVLALAACGGGGGDSPTPQPEDPLAFYKNQKISWNDCSQYVSDTGPYSRYVKYAAKLGSRLQCADIKAPMDYAHPGGLQISLSIMRVLAPKTPAGKPNLLINPGGPGGDGQIYSLAFSQLLSGGNPDSVLGRKYKELSDSYNFVGFSPRGVGASSNLICAGNELEYKVDPTKWGDGADNLRKITNQARYTASNCQKNPISGYVNTDATARDMDLMRHLLGDEKLHYYGTSYGTWLGFWYAGLFPEKAGPMVLDSNMNFSRPIHQASISYTEGQIHTFTEFIAPYAARHDAILGLGQSADAVINGLNGIGHSVSQALHMTGESFRAERDGIPDYLGLLKAAIETQKLLDQGESLDDIERILTEGEYIHDSPELEEAFKEQVSDMVDQLKKLAEPTYYTNAKPFLLENEDSVWHNVVCSDEPLHRTEPDFWLDTGFELARRSPIADNQVASQPCLYWQRQADLGAKPTLEQLKTVPLMMVQSEFDVPTPASGAKETFDKLPNANMVYIESEGAHGLFAYQTQCVDLTVMDYLLGKPPAERLTQCDGLPLPLDEQAATQSKQLKSSGGEEVSNFADPELAQELIGVLRNASRR